MGNDILQLKPVEKISIPEVERPKVGMMIEIVHTLRPVVDGPVVRNHDEGTPQAGRPDVMTPNDMVSMNGSDFQIYRKTDNSWVTVQEYLSKGGRLEDLAKKDCTGQPMIRRESNGDLYITVNFVRNNLPAGEKELRISGDFFATPDQTYKKIVSPTSSPRRSYAARLFGQCVNTK